MFFASMAANAYAVMSILLPVLPVLLGAEATLEPVASTSVSDAGWPPCLWCDSDCSRLLARRRESLPKTFRKWP